jgi:hypothetical protein
MPHDFATKHAELAIADLAPLTAEPTSEHVGDIVGGRLFGMRFAGTFTSAGGPQDVRDQDRTVDEGDWRAVDHHQAGPLGAQPTR